LHLTHSRPRTACTSHTAGHAQLAPHAQPATHSLHLTHSQQRTACTSRTSGRTWSGQAYIGAAGGSTVTLNRQTQNAKANEGLSTELMRLNGCTPLAMAKAGTSQGGSECQDNLIYSTGHAPSAGAKEGGKPGWIWMSRRLMPPLAMATTNALPSGEAAILRQPGRIGCKCLLVQHHPILTYVPKDLSSIIQF